MPIYDFHCKKCRRRVELLINEAANPLCPLCRLPMDKECSCRNFVLKGEGWAKDRYARKKE